MKKNTRASHGKPPQAQTAETPARAGEIEAKAPKAVPARKPAKSRPSVLASGLNAPREWWVKGRQFFREVRVELKKVTWPTRKETIASTSVVLVLVVLSAIFLGLVDLGLSRLIRAVVG